MAHFLQLFYLSFYFLQTEQKIYILNPNPNQSIKPYISKDFLELQNEDCGLIHYHTSFMVLKENYPSFINWTIYGVEDVGRYFAYSRVDIRIIFSFEIKMGYIRRGDFLPESLPTEFHVGQMAVMSCNIVGLPRPEVNWEKFSDSWTTVLSNNTWNYLVLSNISKNDEGSYRCIGHNSYGEVTSKVIKLFLSNATSLQTLYILNTPKHQVTVVKNSNLKLIDMKYHPKTDVHVMIYFHKSNDSEAVFFSKVSLNTGVEISNSMYNLVLAEKDEEYVWKKGNTIIKTHSYNMSRLCPRKLFEITADTAPCSIIWFHGNDYLHYGVIIKDGFRLDGDNFVQFKGTPSRYYNLGTYQSIAVCVDEMMLCEKIFHIKNDVTPKDLFDVMSDKNTIFVNWRKLVLKRHLSSFNIFLYSGVDLIYQIKTMDYNHTFLHLNFSQLYTILITDSNYNVIGDLQDVQTSPAQSDITQPIYKQNFSMFSPHSCSVIFSNIIWNNPIKLIKIANTTRKLGQFSNLTIGDLVPNKKYIFNISLCNTNNSCTDIDTVGKTLHITCYTKITAAPVITIERVGSTSLTVKATHLADADIFLNLTNATQGEYYPTSTHSTLYNLQSSSHYCIRAKYYYNISDHGVVMSERFSEVCAMTKRDVMMTTVCIGAGVAILIMFTVIILWFKFCRHTLCISSNSQVVTAIYAVPQKWTFDLDSKSSTRITISEQDRQ